MARSRAPKRAKQAEETAFRFGDPDIELVGELLAIEDHLVTLGLDERNLAAARLVSVVRRALLAPADNGELGSELTAAARRVEKLLGLPTAGLMAEETKARIEKSQGVGAPLNARAIPGVTADKQLAELVKSHVVAVLESAKGKSVDVATEVVIAILADRARGAARLFPIVDAPKWIETLAPIIAAHREEDHEEEDHELDEKRKRAIARARQALAGKLIRACAKLAGYPRPDRLFAIRS